MSRPFVNFSHERINLRTNMDEMRGNSQATKEDLANLKADLIKWFIGTQNAPAALIIYLWQ